MREHENLDSANSRIGDDINPIKKKVPSMSFGKYTTRKDISEGAYSANEERFNIGHNSVFSDSTTKLGVNIEKYASREARSSVG